MSASVEIPPLEIEFKPHHGETRRLVGLEEIKTFIQTEASAFNEVLSASRVKSDVALNELAGLRKIWSQIQTYLQALIGAIDQLANERDQNSIASRKVEIVRIVSNLGDKIRVLYSQHEFWLSTYPEAQFVIALAKSDPAEGAYAFLHLKGADGVDMNYVGARNGFFKAELFKAGITELRVAAESRAFEGLRKQCELKSEKLSNDYGQFRAGFEALQKEATDFTGAISRQKETQQQEFENWLKSKESAFIAQRDAVAADLKKTATTYSEYMKLKAPVEYWREKKDGHRKQASKLKWWTIGVAAVLFLGLGAYIFFYIHTAAANQIPWREILGFFVLSSLTIWVVRILVRLLLSAIHLGEDAAEREVMAMTYMALVRGDNETPTKYLDEKDRALVLAPLFRPSATGIVNDDAAPAQIVDLLAKVRGGP